LLDRRRITVGKRENALYQMFVPAYECLKVMRWTVFFTVRIAIAISVVCKRVVTGIFLLTSVKVGS